MNSWTYQTTQDAKTVRIYLKGQTFQETTHAKTLDPDSSVCNVQRVISTELSSKSSPPFSTGYSTKEKWERSEFIL